MVVVGFGVVVVGGRMHSPALQDPTTCLAKQAKVNSTVITAEILEH